MGRPAVDMTGKSFGKITVIERATDYAETPVKWLCLCECGNKIIVPGGRLRNGSSKSCGCSRYEFVAKAQRTHGMSKTRIYKTWSHMIERCTCKTHKQYPYYGGRGITVHNEWLDFTAFYNWAIENGYTEELTIDRIDVNGNYEPSNCRWADRYTQQNNMRRTIKITIDGVTQSLSDWSRQTGISKGTLDGRYRKGERGKELIRQPYKRRKA